MASRNAMIRPRKGVHNNYDYDANYNTNIYNSNNNNDQQNRYTQSSIESNTTASTASLLGQHYGEPMANAPPPPPQPLQPAARASPPRDRDGIIPSWHREPAQLLNLQAGTPAPNFHYPPPPSMPMMTALIPPGQSNYSRLQRRFPDASAATTKRHNPIAGRRSSPSSVMQVIPYGKAIYGRNRRAGIGGPGPGPGAGVKRTNAIPEEEKNFSHSSSSSSNNNIEHGHSIRCIRRPRLWWPAFAHKRAQQQQQQQQRNTLSATKEIPKDATTTMMAAAGDDYTLKACNNKVGIVEKGKSFIMEYLEGSSIHGFIYLAKIGLSFVERMLWFSFICVALFSIISLSHRTWERFQTSPMVISMDRNKLVWNTSFPSLTVCPHRRVDELKVDEYMSLHPEQFVSDQDKEDFHDFMFKLASLSYENIETLPVNKTFGIPSENYLDLLYELKWNFEPEISSGAAVKMFIYETLTEFGICHSVNSLVARYNAYDYWKSNDWQLLDHGSRVTVHPLDGEIYAQIINLSTAYDVYFHGAGDIPNISKQRYTFPESDYTTVELIALEIYTAEDARAFTTKQRKCRFQYEAEDMLTVPIYSFGLCLAECRMFFALKVCGCVPHFYRNRLKNGRILPVCNFKGLSCIADIKREIISLKSDRYKIDCNCLSNCDDSNFFVQSYETMWQYVAIDARATHGHMDGGRVILDFSRSRVWFLGANLQWGIIDYPKMQLRRDVLFSFADVLVYIGGLVGFFLGCSALSFTELLYFFTARFIRRMMS